MSEKENITIQVKDASIFQGKHLVLDNLELTAAAGDFFYLIGKTGSGKSTFLKALFGSIPFFNGFAEVAGFVLTPINERKVPFLRRKVGMIFQDFHLLTDRNLFENMSFVLEATGWKDKRLIEQRIQETMEMVGMGTKGFKMPHELSGGEQQRAVIARALLNNPQVILADEPTASLDPQLTLEILDLLHQIAHKGTTLLMATHDYTLIKKKPAKVLLFENQGMLMAEPSQIGDLG